MGDAADLSPGRLTRKVRLVYRGNFDSMDGPVEITDEVIKKLAEVHNNKFAKFGGAPPPAECPPIQVDHSVSGWDTVGRLMGPLEVAEEEIEGEKRLALFGDGTLLGNDNCERLRDGRWTSVSIGADIDPKSSTFGMLKELTIVPFGAAPKAAFLAAGDPKVDAKAKLKKHLKAHKKLSEKEADEEVEKMSEEEVKKNLSRFAEPDGDEYGKLAEPHLEPDGDEPPHGKDKLAAARTKLIRLSAQAHSHLEAVQLAAVKSDVGTKLARLRAETKITPAEIKKLDLGKIARMSKGERDALFSGFENREPVIAVGQFGSVKALDSSQILTKQAKMAHLEAETRKNFKSLGAKRLEAGQDQHAAATPATPIEPQVEGEQKLSAEDVSAHLELIHKHLKAGDHEAAMRHLKHLSQLWGAHCAESLPPSTGKSEAEMAAMTEQVAQLAGSFTQIQELVASLVA